MVMENSSSNAGSLNSKTMTVEAEAQLLEEQARAWLSTVLEKPIDTHPPLCDLLGDGEILLSVAKKLYKDCGEPVLMNVNEEDVLEGKQAVNKLLQVKSLDKSQSMSRGSWTSRSNVHAFLQICRQMGLSDMDLCIPSDVVDAKNMRRVYLCLRALSRRVREIGARVPDFDTGRVDEAKKNYKNGKSKGRHSPTKGLGDAVLLEGDEAENGTLWPSASTVMEILDLDNIPEHMEEASPTVTKRIIEDYSFRKLHRVKTRARRSTIARAAADKTDNAKLENRNPSDVEAVDDTESESGDQLSPLEVGSPFKVADDQQCNARVSFELWNQGGTKEEKRQSMDLEKWNTEDKNTSLMKSGNEKLASENERGQDVLPESPEFKIENSLETLLAEFRNVRLRLTKLEPWVSKNSDVMIEKLSENDEKALVYELEGIKATLGFLEEKLISKRMHDVSGRNPFGWLSIWQSMGRSKSESCASGTLQIVDEGSKFQQVKISTHDELMRQMGIVSAPKGGRQLLLFST